MKNYLCENCGKQFDQKSHYDSHKNKKKSCRKCNIHFKTQFAYINNEQIHISDYNKDLMQKPKCINGHELIFCKGTVKKPYFKHKNSDDVSNHPEMSEWHCKWQGFFPITEIEFNKKCENQMKNRRADVVLNDKYILEIQHSDIADSEVCCRAQDYKLHNKDVIWVIDGNTSDIVLDKLADGSYLIEFNCNWKYKSFVYNYDYVLLDINELIFKIPVKNVCNKMFHARSYKNIDEVVDILIKNPENIWSLWKDTNEIKPTLKVIQQGAGNGKTFGIWKTVSLNFDKELYIITTKQHSAKEVILKELNDQAERKEFHIIDNIEELKDETFGSQYKVTYKHKKSNRKCLVIIGTIDSFVWNLSSKSIGGNNYFQGLLNGIIKSGCDKMNTNTGEIYYAGQKIKLNKMTELWIDETQDLPIIYYKAIIKLILNTKIDCVVIGDKLQSLEYENNFITHIDNDNNINFIREKPVNINRRIKVKYMAEKINELIHFEKFGLPKIIVENDDDLEYRGENVIEIFSHKSLNEAECQVDNIINMVDKEVEQYHYNPEDFLFIFPIMKNNLLADKLETKLNEYWLNKLNNNNKYIQYAFLHKHEEGQVINTKKSEFASRIMSIRAAKGDGRAVVFVLNCTESNLKMVSNFEKNMVYESHFHVAMTRAKYKIYFGLEENNDDIHNRFAKLNENIEYIPKIKTSLSINKIAEYIDKDKVIEILKNNGINDEYFEDENNCSHQTTRIDWDYHCIRHSIYYNYALFEIFNHTRNNNELFKESQIKTVLDNISELKICTMTPKEFYQCLNNQTGDLELDKFPLCIQSNKPIYEEYCNKIKKIMLDIQTKYNEKNLSIGILTPLESCILVYMIDVYKNKIYHSIRPCSLYNIIDSFEKNDEIEQLITESKNMKKNMKILMDKILIKKNINWNIEHIIKFNGNNENLKLHNRYSIIGNDDNNVYHLVFQTDYNRLNYLDTIIKLLLERFLIKNANTNEYETNNQKRFSNKKITTYLLILKQNKYEIFDWNFEDNINDEMKKLCRDAFIKYFKNYNKELFNYCKFIKKDKPKWEKFNSPYEFIAKQKEFKYASYIINFFNNLHIESISGKRQEIRDITDNQTKFYEKINIYIDDMCNAYFLFNSVHDETEW
jgi:hypothetical protein